MTYSLKQRKISALRHAHKVIKSEEEDFICYALDEYAYKFPNSEKAVDYLLDYVSGALDKHNTLSGWVKDKKNLDFYPWRDNPMIRRTRLAWIEWMLECYGAKV